MREEKGERNREDVRYPIAKARGLDLYSVPGCPGAGLSEPPFPIL